ncbi:MAG: hypothetical protein A3G33_03890 [Omnitrophica bacterium RIFCSPLOWO2_12_FULL_44_17]|uniref:Divergent polysaccharide deacetylase n=1 Tax=Candidatus Danuiimicrobium aquiferis TaxID=1801832 RepID=A0A1G1KSM9_9BACT|nr:MAG: hypothetical protein A3B72_02150 [Omnitrophica bacterium RIFCSPHIGHO2_02_FULL_45_28]OGW91443.1 MAG: hypothetical protein A3E74_08415 [Omnitrophica bacterium RIFCSPHIGHO2_12_FULL_44_12]OGW95920.1 MAG: hypothetical protein A3G33_03890 [Omnitrophica bacterium RIFCSPLOWO2_12_FULL_44_17]OGX01919.1 MAG: hypothetical protein A3J12_05305 [Omnitrophica bacterium RIFCSPLOWO2_02_FULL_44_11]
MRRKKFSFFKFLKNNPVVIVFTIIFIAGLWLGFNIGRKSVEWEQREGRPLRKTYTAEKKKIPSESPFAAFFRKREVKIVPQSGVGKIGRPVKISPVPKKKGLPRVVIMLDDIGYSKAYKDILFSIQPKMTLAILPQVVFTKYYVQEAKKRGYETILHQPLEPDNENGIYNPGAGVILTSMKPDEVRNILSVNLNDVPWAVGINNHMGSKATRDEVLMEILMGELKTRKLFFLDSLTHSKSIAYDVALSEGIPAFKRDVFLDRENDFEYIKGQFAQAVQIAKEQGYAVAIGHPYDNTLQVLKLKMPTLKNEGVQISTLKDLLQDANARD